MSDEKKTMTVHEAAREYLYPILKTVNVTAPLTGLDLERAFFAGFDYGMVSALSDEQLENYRKEVLNTITKLAGSGLEVSESDA